MPALLLQLQGPAAIKNEFESPGLQVAWASRPPAAQPVTSTHTHPSRSRIKSKKKKKTTTGLESSQDPVSQLMYTDEFVEQPHYASPNGTGDYYTIRRRMCYRVQNALRSFQVYRDRLKNKCKRNMV